MPAITGRIQDEMEAAYVGPVEFENLDAPCVGGTRVTGPALTSTITDTNGFLPADFRLAPGRTRFVIDGRKSPVFVVPDSDTSYDLATLMGSSITRLANGSFRIKGGKFQIWNPTQLCWHDLFAFGQAGAEQVALGDPDTTSQLDGGVNLAPSDWARLLEIAASEGYQIVAAAYDDDGVVTTATVLWPDGSSGAFTTVTKNTDFLTVDAYTLTHENSGKTVTQSTVSRNSDGQITIKPALTLT